jgi:SAM-dependent methyltransferase
MDEVRAQYERYPYPPVPAFALPRRGQGAALAWERGAGLAGRDAVSHEGIRILVAGCGTLEALVVAQAHPKAKEVVAVDISEASISRLRLRVRLARIAHVVLGLGLRSRIPPIRVIRADLATWDGGEFDYVVATDVLHHHEDPAGLMGRLARSLRPGGLMRIVTYTAQGRIWMRAIGRWLTSGGLTAESSSLSARAHARIAELAPDNPLRLSFHVNSESRSATGLVDAYLHACENPMSPESWGDAASAAGLRLVAQDHSESSQSGFVDELWPQLSEMGDWSKLGLLDDLLELVANPVLWFEPGESRPPRRAVLDAAGSRAAPPAPGITLSMDREVEGIEVNDVLWLPSRIRWEIGLGLARARARVEPHGVTQKQLVEVLRTEVGCRVNDQGSDLPGLTLHEHAPETLDGLPEPWSPARLQELAARLCAGAHLVMAGSGERVAGQTLDAQVETLQGHRGPLESWIGPLRIEG